MLIKCPECKKTISDKASICPSCGCPLSEETTIEISKNPYSKRIILTVVVQILLLFMPFIFDNVIGGLAFFIGLILFYVIFVLSVLCIKNSKKYNKKGKKTGLFFSLIYGFLSVLISFTIIVGVVTENTGDNKIIKEGIDTAANMSVEALKDKLKDPNSLEINNIYAIVYDSRIKVKHEDGTIDNGGDFKGWFEIYIDYSARNGFGGYGREYYYFEYDSDFNLRDYGKKDNMPTMTNDVWVLDANKYN